MGYYVDQYHTSDGWRFTEDISFFTSVTLNVSSVAGGIQKVPITFAQPPLTSFNRVPDAATAFIFLRRLDICCQNPLPWRTPTWVWNQAIDTTLGVANGNSSTTIFFVANPTPTGLVAVNTPVALRRLQFDTIPAGVTFTSVQVTPGWTAATDTLHTNTAIASNTSIDMCAFYDNQLGLVNTNVIDQQSTQIAVKYNTGNTTGSTQNVNVQLYGMQYAYQWAQWLLQYQPPNGGQFYDIGQYDDVQTPEKSFTLDKLIPVSQVDTGVVSLGNLIFTANRQLGFYSATTDYDIMLTATLAYLIP